MAERTGKCTRFGNCSMADTGAEVTIAEGADALCPECGKELMVKTQGTGRTKLIGAVIGVLVTMALGLGALTFFGGERAPAKGSPSAAPALPEVAQPRPQTEVPAAVGESAPVAPAPTVEALSPVLPVPSQYEGMVQVADFWIDQTEVSVGAFKALFPGYKVPKGFHADLPVVDVTWADAQRFAEQSGKRLCRDREWLFALGEVMGSSGANLSGDAMDRPRPVNDTRDRNDRGLLNMLGNVSEWVDAGGEGAAFVGGYWYWSNEARADAELTRVNRLATKRNYHHYIGFRCCRDALPTSEGTSK